MDVPVYAEGEGACLVVDVQVGGDGRPEWAVMELDDTGLMQKQDYSGWDGMKDSCRGVSCALH